VTYNIGSVLSLVTYMCVGMQQNHSRVPWQANLKDDQSNTLKMHIQGVLQHGEKIDMYHTFTNTQLVRVYSVLVCVYV
jgi:hypothetical protein